MKIRDLTELEERAEKHIRRAKDLESEAEIVRRTRRKESSVEIKGRVYSVDSGTVTSRGEALARAWETHGHDILRSVEMDLLAQARRERAAARIVQANLERMLAAAAEVAGPADPDDTDHDSEGDS